MDYTYEQIAKMIDHSLLHPTMTDQELVEGCRIAAEYGCATACVKPYFTARCAELLAGTDVKANTTIGFPHGGHKTAVKVVESERALADGATELDMVCNVGKVLSEDWDYVREDIRAVVQAGHAEGALVKVIFCNDFLPEDRFKIGLCEICSEVGADFVKTSTGYDYVKDAEGHYYYAGAIDHDLKLMREHSAPEVQVKAAGAVRSLDRLLEVRELGVTRVGASRTVKMLDECRERLEG